MEERITYSGKSGNNLTGATRGANSTIALEHRKGCFVEKYVAIASAEANSSIGTNGLLDFTATNRNLLDLPTAELIASNKLLGGLEPVQRIIIIPNEAFETSENRELGDLITITDAESDLDDDFRIVGMTFASYYGDLSLELECSNRTLTFIEQMQKDKEANENISKYMQGSTTSYNVNQSENCDDSTYLNMRFFVPNEAIAINKVLLNFKLEDYRSYTTVSEINSESSIVDPEGNGAISAHGLTTSFSTIRSWVTSSADRVGEWVIFTQYQNGGAGRKWFRVYDGTNYYPDSSGIRVTPSINNDVMATVIFCPGNLKSKTLTLQGKMDSGTGTIYGDANAWGDATHTHSMGYEINEETLTSPSIDLYTGEDGGSMTFKATYTTDQDEIDLTSEVSTVGAGKWINLQFRPNKNMRIEANSYIQIFIESK